MREHDVQQICDVLMRRKSLTSSQLAQFRTKSETTGQDLLTVLVDADIIPEEEMTRLKADASGMSYVNLADREIIPAVLNSIPQNIAKNYRVVPFEHIENTLSVALDDPYNVQAISAVDFLARNLGLRAVYHVASASAIATVIRQYATMAKEVAQALTNQESELSDVEQDTSIVANDDNVEIAPVSKMVSVILRYAVEGHASDVHIEPTSKETRVRYRVDGLLHTSLHIPRSVHSAIVARIKVLANLKLDETRLPQDGRFRMMFEGREVDFRVSTFPLVGAEKVELRILDKESGMHTLENLGFQNRSITIVHENLKQPHGMLLMTGPTGAGKSTTLYAMLQLLNNEERNIVTLEDPVEYYIPGVAQSQINPDIGLTFARGLRSILRQDPDIIMVGEIRDNETAELAIHAALTGHMVLSTLHTNDAIGAIPRLVDMKVEPFLVASALRLIVAQRLVRRNCEFCAALVTVSDAVQQHIHEELQNIADISFPKDIHREGSLTLKAGKGCEKCENTGFKGRLAIVECIQVNESIQQLIASGEYKNVDTLTAQLQLQGMVTLRQDGILKALQGLTTIEEVWTVTRE